MNAKAVKLFTIGEDFVHWGSYEATNRHFWAAVFSVHDLIFFRPVAKFWVILSHWLMPRIPLAYHVRNLALLALAAGFLYLLMARLTRSRLACLIGLGFFLTSKVHSSAIGYAASVDSVLSLTQALAAVWLLVVGFQTGVGWARVGSYVLLALTAGTRDYGLALIGVFVVAWVIESGFLMGRIDAQRLVLGLAPALAIGAGYLAVRFMVMKTLSMGGGANYTPSFAPRNLLEHAWLAWGSIWNLTLETPGHPGGALAATPTPLFLLLAAAAATFAASAVWMIREDRRVLIPLSLLLAFLLPTLTVREVKVYYLLEPLAGLSVFGAMTMDRLFPSWNWTKVLAICILSVTVWLGVVDARKIKAQPWYGLAEAAQAAYEVIRSQPELPRAKLLTLVCEGETSRDVWTYVLNADGKGPMLQFLLRRPDLPIWFAHGYELPMVMAGREVKDVVLVEKFMRFVPYRQPVVQRLVPRSAKAGEGFNVQPDGNSVLWIEADGISADSVVFMDGRRLISHLTADHGAMSAIIPREYFTLPGKYHIWIANSSTGLTSLRVVFEVVAKQAPSR